MSLKGRVETWNPIVYNGNANTVTVILNTLPTQTIIQNNEKIKTLRMVRQ
jgi:hypothetical protein